MQSICFPQIKKYNPWRIVPSFQLSIRFVFCLCVEFDETKKGVNKLVLVLMWSLSEAMTILLFA